MRKTQAAAFAVILCCAASGAVAQTGNPGGSTSQNSRSPYGAPSQDADTPISPAIRERIEKGRQSDRQKRLIADTDRLLALANELKSDMDKSSKDTMSTQVIKKAEDIEKLARSIRDRM